MARARIIPKIENPFETGEDFEKLLAESGSAQPIEGTVVRGVITALENDIATVDIGFKMEGHIPLREFFIEERQTLKPGDKVEVFVERIENAKGEAVLSRERAAREESWDKLSRFHNENKNVNGIIVARVKGGFTVDLDGATAFLPGSQVDVRPVKDVAPIMGIVQPFQILKMDRKRGNIVVSRRAIMEESRSAERAEALAGIEEGKVVEGTVKNITDYGAFIDLGAIDGLLHVTDISWQRVSHPSEVLKIGQKVKAKVIKYDKDNKRISLGIKQLEESPWDAVRNEFTAGARFKGHVTNITDYGAFVEIRPGVEGLVHVSEMSWTKKNIHPNKLVTSGQEVEVEVLSVDYDKHRLSLGMKQCQANPWEEFAKNRQVGEILEGEIKSIADFGLFVGFGGQVDGLVHVSDLSWEAKPEESLKNYKKGEKISVKILEIDPSKERISLGVKQLREDPLEGVLGQYKKGSVATFTVSAVKENGIEVTVADDITSFIKKSELSRDKVECRPERFSVGDRIDAKVIDIDPRSRTVKLSIRAMEVDEQKQAIAEFGSADSGATLGNILGVALDSAKKENEEKKGAKKKKTEEAVSEEASNDSVEEKPKKRASKKAAE